MDGGSREARRPLRAAGLPEAGAAILLESAITDALGSVRAASLTGARQVGKTTRICERHRIQAVPRALHAPVPRWVHPPTQGTPELRAEGDHLRDGRRIAWRDFLAVPQFQRVLHHSGAFFLALRVSGAFFTLSSHFSRRCYD